MGDVKRHPSVQPRRGAGRTGDTRRQRPLSRRGRRRRAHGHSVRREEPYEDFSATTDDEVRALLEEARGWGRRAQAV